MISKIIEQHKVHIHKVFQRIPDYNFKLKEEKYEFFMQQIKNLEQLIYKNRGRLDSERASAIKNMPASENILSLQNFIGLTDY